MPEPNRTLDLLLQLMRNLRRNYDNAAADLGLTMSRTRLITTLATMEGATQAELAQALQIEAPTLKRQIDGLAALGFIERRGMEGDARKRALFLTDKARDSVVSRFVQVVRAELFIGIPAEDRLVLERSLDRMLDNAERIGVTWNR